MDPVVAVAHYPEGAGHATRMLAVAKALESEGATVHTAGGGPGARFVEMHGYDHFVPATVDYIDDYQDGGSLLHVLTNSVPMSGKRVIDYARWLRRIGPDALVTDDMFAAMAATLTRTPLYVLTHNAPGFYDAWVEETFTDLLTEYQLAAAREFYYPAVWSPAEEDPEGVEHVPPVALDGEVEGHDEPGVVMVPSHYSNGFEDLAERLRKAGHAVTLVGEDGWEPVAAMVPVLRRAEAVVCSGYSTMMEAAVAGTPCIVYPFTDEQRGVARVIDRQGVAGFRVVRSTAAVVDAVASPPTAPGHDNGAAEVGRRIVADIAARKR